MNQFAKFAEAVPATDGSQLVDGGAVTINRDFVVTARPNHYNGVMQGTLINTISGVFEVLESFVDVDGWLRDV